MAENRKLYRTQEMEDGIGTIKIADEVVSIIAALAATEVEGISSMAGNITSDVISKLSIKSLSRGVKINIEAGVVDVNLAVNIAYGQNILEASQKVQEKVKSSIENMTGLKVGDVNVRVAGIDMED